MPAGAPGFFRPESLLRRKKRIAVHQRAAASVAESKVPSPETRTLCRKGSASAEAKRRPSFCLADAPGFSGRHVVLPAGKVFAAGSAVLRQRFFFKRTGNSLSSPPVSTRSLYAPSSADSTEHESPAGSQRRCRTRPFPATRQTHVRRGKPRMYNRSFSV